MKSFTHADNIYSLRIFYFFYKLPSYRHPNLIVQFYFLSFYKHSILDNFTRTNSHFFPRNFTSNLRVSSKFETQRGGGERGAHARSSGNDTIRFWKIQKRAGKFRANRLSMVFERESARNFYKPVGGGR